MAQILTVYRVGTEWAFRDVTGATYGHSCDLGEVIVSAEQMALRQAGRVVLSPEAEEQRRTSMQAGLVNTQPALAPTRRRAFRDFVSRFARKKRGI